MLPPVAVKDRSILDLGCCVGATGYWCLHHGASSYTGVEIQEAYASAARTNLTKYFGGKAEVLEEGVEDFVLACERQFDVVVLAGILHAFMDFVPVLQKVAAITRKAIVVETPFPSIQAEGERFPLDSLIEVRPGQRMNLATENASAIVWGAVPSPVALRIVMARFGFRQVHHGRSPWLGRYISVFEPGEKGGVEFSEVVRGASAFTEPWIETSSYQGAGSSGEWTFDADVAEVFSQIARQNIPNYQAVLHKCLDVARLVCQPNDKIIDVGCATGATLQLMRSNGFSNLYGVDSSPAMVEAASKTQAKIVLSESFPGELGPFRLVTANWTLHFIKHRMAYLDEVFEALEPGGALVLTDKMRSGAEMRSLYHGFKRERGMTEEQILAKEKALEGVLTPLPLTDYLAHLSARFRTVDVLDASYGFVTLLAVK